jgi:phage regulator Rha-like protein
LRYLTLFCVLTILTLSNQTIASAVEQTKGKFVDKFRQMEEILPTPNNYRAASGEPGQDYWQQKVEYKMRASLDEQSRSLSTRQEISCRNNSPSSQICWA